MLKIERILEFLQPTGKNMEIMEVSCQSRNVFLHQPQQHQGGRDNGNGDAVYAENGEIVPV